MAIPFTAFRISGRIYERHAAHPPVLYLQKGELVRYLSSNAAAR